MASIGITNVTDKRSTSNCCVEKSQRTVSLAIKVVVFLLHQIMGIFLNIEPTYGFNYQVDFRTLTIWAFVFLERPTLGFVSRKYFFNLLRIPRIDSMESIPPAYVAWRAGTTTLFLLGS
jgi:hypothetical protein